MASYFYLNSISRYLLNYYNLYKIINIPKFNVSRFGQLPLLIHYAPFSPILSKSINKLMNIRKFNCFKLDQLPLIKYYAPLCPILL